MEATKLLFVGYSITSCHILVPRCTRTLGGSWTMSQGDASVYAVCTELSLRKNQFNL